MKSFFRVAYKFTKVQNIFKNDIEQGFMFLCDYIMHVDLEVMHSFQAIQTAVLPVSGSVKFRSSN